MTSQSVVSLAICTTGCCLESRGCSVRFSLDKSSTEFPTFVVFFLRNANKLQFIFRAMLSRLFPTQRTSGLHTESAVEFEAGCGGVGRTERYQTWGGGLNHATAYSGGIFMGSNVAATCAVTHCSLEPTAIGLHGSVEHMVM
jgi:hypothetical protein